MELRNKNIIITGASTGIGKALSIEIANYDCNLFILARRIELLEEIKELIWKNCVLCGRCYCPLGIDIPGMIALARSICRSYGVYGVYPHSLGEPL